MEIAVSERLLSTHCGHSRVRYVRAAQGVSRMPLWTWFFIAFCITYFALVLWRAWDRHHFKYGPIIYSLEETPICFWFFAFVFIVCELFFVVLFILAIVSSIWGPVFHQ